MRRGKANRGGRAGQQLTALVLATYGRVCHLQLPGCTKVATTKDHIVPYVQGGTDALSNFRPACKTCNSKRQDRNLGARVKVITGPPGAGKSTYVREHAGPADVIIDLDRIARAIMHEDTEGTHDYPDHIRHVAIGMRSAAIQRATRLRESAVVWLIHSVPKPDQLTEYERMRWEIVAIDPGRAVVDQRVRDQRPAAVRSAVDRWYDQQTAATVGAVGLVEPSRQW